MCCITFRCPKSGGEPGLSLVGHPAVQGEKVFITQLCSLSLAPRKGRLDNLNSLPDRYLSSQCWGLCLGLVKQIFAKAAFLALKSAGV